MIKLSKYTIQNSYSKTHSSGTLIRLFRQKFHAVFFTLFLTTVSSHAYVKLAQEAGISYDEIKQIVKKVVKYESTNGSYHAFNRKTGAYGRYQIMPKTARAYAKKLHIPLSKWKLPQNQDKLFQAIMEDNICSLKRNGYKINAFSIYATHQQGAGGFNAIMKNKKLSKNLERNLRSNLPKKLRSVPRSRLKLVWVNYWKNKFS